MCARYEHVLTNLSAIGELIEECVRIDVQAYEPRPDVRPTDRAPVLYRLENELAVDLFAWGLIPQWSGASGPRPINARIETISTNRLFGPALESRRCIVPATCFVEWQTVGKRKHLHRIRDAGGGLLAFAGLWEPQHGPGGTRTFTILTGPPGPVVATLHDRQPVVIPTELRAAWLAPALQEGVLSALAEPYPHLDIDGGGARQLALF